MNKSLNKYSNNDNIFHVNGWSYPQLLPRRKPNLVGKLALGWGWGTWKSTWQNFNVDLQNNDYINNQDEKTIKKFNFYNLSNFSHQLTYHTSKEIEGVDIFWYQYIFLNNAFTIFPKFSLVSNDGFDGSGTHCGISDKYDYKLKNLPIKNFSNSTIVDSLNNIFTYYFYLKMKIKDYITYHSKKIFTIFQSN